MFGQVPAICVQNVTFSYARADTPALRDVSLEVPRGQCVALTGPSGSGKSTITRLINGLVPHVHDGSLQGRVVVNGQDVSQWKSANLGREVGSVFQNPRSQFVNIDTTSEIAFGCENLGISRDEIVRRVDTSASALGIRNLLGRSVAELSGGQKQSVIIASALSMQPDVFVMDEPTASLDVASMRTLAHVVAQLKTQGKTIVISEHRLWWLNGIADRVVRIDDGRVTGDWTAREYGLIPRRERMERGERAWSVAEMLKETTGSTGSMPQPTRDVDAASGLVAYGLRVGYRRSPRIVDDASMHLARGSVTGMLGKNGAGKTTLLRCLSGLCREKAGEVRVDGVPLRYRARPGRMHLVMQEPGYQLFADSVCSELVQAAKGAGLDDTAAYRAAADALARFGLEEVADRHPLSLSGGQRQRVAIAAGILQGAQVMLLDEPTSGLDLVNMRRVASALHEMAEAGLALGVVTHDFEFLQNACDAALQLEGGKPLETYPLDDTGLHRALGSLGLGQTRG